MNQTAICDLPPAPTFFPGVVAGGAQDSDFALARAAAGGADDALSELYVRHRRRVYALCMRMTRNAADAEDLTQDVFVHLLGQVGSFRGDSLFTTWLHRFTINQVLMCLRRDARRRGLMPDYIQEQVSRVRTSYVSAPPPVVDRLSLEAALTLLPPGYRWAFVLHDIEGYSHEEVSGILGCSAGTSKSQLHKARMKLRRLLLKSARARRC
ncbi:MAG: RNA polymerase sigma factor [Pyrinomonadaceae bacterium]